MEKCNSPPVWGNNNIIIKDIIEAKKANIIDI